MANQVAELDRRRRVGGAVTFDEWLVAAVPRSIRLATALTGSPDLAGDLVQDVMIKVQQRWVQIERLDHPDAYVRRMLVNEHLSFRRRFSRVSQLTDVEPAPDDRPHFDEQYVDRQALIGELRRLPARQRTVLVLRYYEGLDDAAIAAVLGCRPSTVRAYATRALATLRVQVSSEEGK